MQPALQVLPLPVCPTTSGTTHVRPPIYIYIILVIHFKSIVVLHVTLNVSAEVQLGQEDTRAHSDTRALISSAEVSYCSTEMFTHESFSVRGIKGFGFDSVFNDWN